MLKEGLTLFATIEMRNAMQDYNGDLLWYDKKEVLKALKQSVKGKRVITDKHGEKVLLDNHISNYDLLQIDGSGNAVILDSNTIVFGNASLMEKYYPMAENLIIVHLQEVLFEAVNVTFPNFDANSWGIEIKDRIGVQHKYGYNICLAEYNKFE